MNDPLVRQYQYVQATRQTLFAFLEGIPTDGLHRALTGFGSGSIARTHLHVADCYRSWLGKFALRRRDLSFATDEEMREATVAVLRISFQSVDALVQDFLNEFQNDWLQALQNEVRWQTEPLSTTPLWLFTHTITHEFHHKGQIVAMARQLGYAPPDTDLAL